MVAAAVLPAALAHSVDVADTVVSTAPAPVATPSISFVTPSASAPVTYAP